MFHLLALFDQFVVPLLAKVADERLFEVLVERYAAFLAFCNGTATDIPAVVVDGLELAILVYSERVEVATDGFGPVNLAVVVGLLYGTICGAVVAPYHVGTLTVVNQRGAGLGSVIEGGDTLAVDDIKSLFSHIWLHPMENLFKDGYLRFEQGRTTVAFDATLSLALRQVATETLVGDVF